MRLYLFLLLLLLTSCVGPDYERPVVAVPSTWKNHLPTGPSQNQKMVDTTWWQNFHDPQLEELIEEAVASNLDYRAALARIQEARANLAGVEANLFPTISGTGSASRTYTGPGVPRSSLASSPSPSGTTTSSQQTLYKAGFDASWELDLFGAVRRGEESALAILESVIEDSRATLLSLFAEVAQNYINLRNFQHQVEVAQEIVSLWQDNFNLQSQLERTGLASQAALAAAQSSLDQAQAVLPSLESNIKATLHRLGVLLGKNPTTLYARLLKPGKIPESSEAVIAGLPSELVHRRPDIQMNERLLASATAQIGVSMASLFPQFQLTGSFNFERNQPSRLFMPSNQYWQYGLAFSIPIFDFGKIRAQIEAKYAQKEEALLAYQKSILTALEEVENGLVNFANESIRYHRVHDQVVAQEQAYHLVRSRYKAGLNNYGDVIQAKIAFLNAKLASIQSRATVSLNLVALYKALGGGWETYTSDSVKNLGED